jgi:hypothetical protein
MTVNDLIAVLRQVNNKDVEISIRLFGGGPSTQRMPCLRVQAAKTLTGSPCAEIVTEADDS